MPVGVTAQPAVFAAPDLGAKQAVGDLLVRWTRSFRDKDLSEYLRCYAPSLTAYYTKRNVTRALVESEVTRFFRRYPAVAHFDVRNVSVTKTGPDQLRVVFEKTWDVNGRGKFAGREMQELLLRRDADNWHITSEQELRVLKLIRE